MHQIIDTTPLVDSEITDLLNNITRDDIDTNEINPDIIKADLDMGLEDTGFQLVDDIEIPERFNSRVKCGIRQIDEHLLDEGILPGSTFTLTAMAGCGKTTLMLQVLSGMAKNGYKAGYASGEEDIHQLTNACKSRLNVKGVFLSNTTDIDELQEHAKKFDILIIDSFQSLTTEKRMNPREKERYAIQQLTQCAKRENCIIGFILHLTKNGEAKGSTVIPHTVDAVWRIDRIPGALDTGSRVIHLEKNRFGPCNEYETIISRTGYDFNAKVVRENEETDNGLKKATSKSARKQSQLDALMKAASESSSIKLNDVLEFVENDPNRTKFLLNELVQRNELIKVGRGIHAYWYANTENES